MYLDLFEREIAFSHHNRTCFSSLCFSSLVYDFRLTEQTSQIKHSACSGLVILMTVTPSCVLYTASLSKQIYPSSSFSLFLIIRLPRILNQASSHYSPMFESIQACKGLTLHCSWQPSQSTWHQPFTQWSSIKLFIIWVCFNRKHDYCWQDNTFRPSVSLFIKD